MSLAIAGVASSRVLGGRTASTTTGWRGPLVRDHVLLFIFERGPLVRFSHSPSGGGPTPAGDDTSPAWDFQLIVPDYEVGHEYGLRVRLVYKPWAGRDDVLDEVRKAYATVLSQESRPSRPG